MVFMGERKGDHSSPTEYKGVIWRGVEDFGGIT